LKKKRAEERDPKRGSNKAEGHESLINKEAFD